MMRPDKETIMLTINNLQKNNFQVYLAEDMKEAKNIFNNIFAELNPESVSFGDSETLRQTGILDELRTEEINFIDTFSGENWKEQINKRKEALTVDMFLTGSNAITEKGQLVNLDMIGNRVAPVIFGPRRVIIFAGINKIVPDIDSAFKRIREIAAPLNAKRHTDLKTPCQKTGVCSDCSSPQRICNNWVITEKSYPANRIKIILINQEAGL